MLVRCLLSALCVALLGAGVGIPTQSAVAAVRRAVRPAVRPAPRAVVVEPSYNPAARAAVGTAVGVAAGVAVGSAVANSRERRSEYSDSEAFSEAYPDKDYAYLRDGYRGNRRFDSFNKVKKILEREVYYDHRTTLYCGYSFNEKKEVSLPPSFTTPTPSLDQRARRVEWEHVVPAENFGRAFSEWRDGDPLCVRNGKSFRGRNCAERANKDFAYMQSDMYNLFPAVGAVNGLRSNYPFTLLPGVESDFGSCQMKVDEVAKKAEPPAPSRGVVARATLYMADTYGRYSLSKQDRRIFEVWDREHPVGEWECRRTKRIERLQGNENLRVKLPCIERGLW